MNTGKIEKYLQNYLDDVVSPEINSELVGEDDEPIELTVYKVTYGESNPNRINFFIDMYPDYSKGSIICHWSKQLYIQSRWRIYS